MQTHLPEEASVHPPSEVDPFGNLNGTHDAMNLPQDEEVPLWDRRNNATPSHNHPEARQQS
jgi:hypothetical protein